jgi:hypothetical protein
MIPVLTNMGNFRWLLRPPLKLVKTIVVIFLLTAIRVHGNADLKTFPPLSGAGKTEISALDDSLTLALGIIFVFGAYKTGRILHKIRNENREKK